ncbi:nucleotidyltransferase family protein [Deinococcus yavapaiensis]|uniref:Molybdenum cofactor cytidylyltransferase n=1 Tax=Deinococcus yavapaiensis KR-236 TaxID=694435 RepID=A0A318SJB3_9DEIO|nr:nucleotidyltransferase family protein [Deinococcus yavapaiensis]PYE54376.1 molybdenum cofactor cytidylyltransferase [Deinococcus yavapaiensis KR-236]
MNFSYVKIQTDSLNAAERRRLAGVVLAAGASRRMGRNKQLLDVAGEALVRHTVRNVVAAGFDFVLVVLGRDADDVKTALRDMPVTFVVNERYREGIGTSFKVGVDALPNDVEAASFALADMPLVTPAMHRAVTEAYRASRPPLVLARYGEVRAPPHLFRQDLFGRFSGRGDHGPKDLVKEFGGEAVWLDFPEVALTDVDTPEDLQRMDVLLSGKQG